MNTTKILAGGYAICCNDRKEMGYYNLAIRSNLILELTKDLDGLKRKYPEAEIVDAGGKIILPTFFNAHYHPEAIICRSVEPKIPTSQWRDESLLSVESAIESQSEIFYESLYHLAFFSALQCGVSGIAFGVIGDEAGVRGMYSAMKLVGFDAIVFAESDSQTAFLRKVIDKHLKAGTCVPYQKDLTLFGLSAVARINSESPGWVMAHADETEEDVSLTKSNFNLGLVQLLRKSRLLGSTTVLTGLNWTPSNTLKTAKAEGAKIVITPTELTFQNFRSIRNVFDKFAIGSNWKSPGLFEEMRRLIEFGVPPMEALNCATRNGADVFNMGSRVGSMEAGKLANLILIDTKKFAARRIEKLAPESAVSALVEDYSESDVTDVILEGEFVYKDRKLLLYDGDELVKEQQKLTEAVMKHKGPSVQSSARRSSSPKAPSVREEDAQEVETDRGKVELPTTIRKVFGEDDL